MRDWFLLGSAALRPRSVLALLAVLLAVYVFALHPWMMSWGATPAEQQMALPGDELINQEPIRVTRAITVNAPPDKVWPWLMQIGQDRAGFYSYDWLENLFGGDMRRVDEIRPEWQQRHVGEKIPMSRPDTLGGALGDAVYFTVNYIDPPRAIDHMGLFMLLPIDAHTTRVVWREHMGSVGPKTVGQRLGDAFVYLVYDPMHFTMVRQMLRGVKAHAEGQPHPPLALDLPARSGWLLASIGLLGLFLSRPRWRLGLALPLALAAVTLWQTGDWNAALAGFLSLGISLLGFFAWGRRWIAPFSLIAALVLLTLLFAPDAWIAFGLIFLALAVAPAGVILAPFGRKSRGERLFAKPT